MTSAVGQLAIGQPKTVLPQQGDGGLRIVVARRQSRVKPEPVAGRHRPAGRLSMPEKRDTYQVIAVDGLGHGIAKSFGGKPLPLIGGDGPLPPPVSTPKNRPHKLAPLPTPSPLPPHH